MQILISQLRFAAARLVLNRNLVAALVLGPVVGAMLAFGAIAAQDATTKDTNEITIDNFTFTPKELTVYMIAAASAPAVIGTALSYYLRFPQIDFMLISTTLWLVAALTMEWISPVPLPVFLIGAALAPSLIVGAILHWHRYRSGKRSG